MLVKYDMTQAPKVTPCGLLWECFDREYPQLDHAYCTMPWPALPHYHEHMVECYRPVGGQVMLGVGEETQELFPDGPTVFIPPGVPHWAVPMSIGGTEAFTMEVYNAPGWNSFAQPDFVPLSPEVPEHRSVLADWHLAMAAELAVRLYGHGRSGESSPQPPDRTKTSAELARELCLPGYREQFDQVWEAFRSAA